MEERGWTLRRSIFSIVSNWARPRHARAKAKVDLRVHADVLIEALFGNAKVIWPFEIEFEGLLHEYVGDFATNCGQLTN